MIDGVLGIKVVGVRTFSLPGSAREVRSVLQ